MDRQAVLDMMDSFRGDDARYKEGKTWSLVYYIDDERDAFLKQAHNKFMSENGLNPMAFKSLKRFESDVIRMTADMLNGGEECVGCMTSGGTESCLLAVKTYRDRARALKPWIIRPEIILPQTAHVAFEKAAEYFNVKIKRAPLGKDFRADVKKMKRLISRNTIMMVASAPCYPYGVVDPIEELGAIAASKKIPLHVDACLGGFMLPFVERLGYPVPKFDFRVKGVASMSADVHKYGFSAKGASTILYKNMDYFKYQMFVSTDWPGGIFASAGMLGTRPGGSIAAAWAALVATGADGYEQFAKASMETAKKLIDGINAVPGLQVVGSPDMTVFAYRSTEPDVSIYAVGDQMEKRGWHIDRQQRPECLHAMVTPRHAGVVEEYLKDLRESVEIVKSNPELEMSGNAAMYGMVAKIPMRGMIKKNVLKMMTQMYAANPKMPDMSADGNKDDLGARAGLWFLKTKKKLEELKRKFR